MMQEEIFNQILVAVAKSYAYKKPKPRQCNWQAHAFEDDVRGPARMICGLTDLYKLDPQLAQDELNIDHRTYARDVKRFGAMLNGYFAQDNRTKGKYIKFRTKLLMSFARIKVDQFIPIDGIIKI